MRCVNWYGRVLVIGFADGEIPKLPINLVLLKSCQVVGSVLRRVERAVQGRATGKLRGDSGSCSAHGSINPLIGQTFAFDQYAEALRCLSERRGDRQGSAQTSDDSHGETFGRGCTRAPVRALCLLARSYLSTPLGTRSMSALCHATRVGDSSPGIVIVRRSRTQPTPWAYTHYSPASSLICGRSGFLHSPAISAKLACGPGARVWPRPHLHARRVSR